MTENDATRIPVSLHEHLWENMLTGFDASADDTGYTERLAGTAAQPSMLLQALKKLAQLETTRQLQPVWAHLETYEAGLETHEERTAVLEQQTESTDTEAMPYQAIEFRVGPSTGLPRIVARQSDIRRRALKIQQEQGDPIQNLAEMLGNIPGSQEDWNALVDEPY
jgi:hypothetical protein